MKRSLSKPAPAWHAEAIDLVNQHFDAINAEYVSVKRRAAWMGFLLVSIKARGKEDGSIPHGRFMPWLNSTFPHLSDRTAREWMAYAERSFEVANRQISPFSHAGQLPDEVLKVIDSKSKYALFLEWKQAKKDADGSLEPKIGRAEGEGGKPPCPDDPSEALEFKRKYSLRKMGAVDKALNTMSLDLLTHPDDTLTAFDSTLERTHKCIRAWLDTPPAKRDPKAIEKLWKSL